MTSWIYIFIASIFEISWAVGLKYSNGFTNIKSSIFTVITMILSYVFLALGVKTLPIGTAYAVWTGIGAVGTTLYGMMFFNEPKDLIRVFFIFLIVVGIIGLNSPTNHLNMRKLIHEEIAGNRSTLENLHQVKKLPVYVVLNSIRSSYNVGSIFRTSDGVMIEKLYLCGYTPHPPKKEVLKTALGAQESVAWEYVKDAGEIIHKLKNEGIKICALELTENSIPHYKISKADFPMALIVGNEITGVSQELLDQCEMSIEIPQYGIKQSLNVAVAYGISIFDLRRIWES